MRLCSFFFFLSESVGCMCVQWTLFDLGFDSPNIARGTQWIHVHVSVCVNACATACVAACKVIHWLRQTKYDIPATHPVHGQLYANTHTRTHAHTHAQCMHSKHFNTQPHNTRACVYPLCCGQGPRGRLLGSSGPAFRDVISQFRERWGEKQEESRRELVQQEHYPKEIPHCWSSRAFKRWRCLAVRTRYVKYK